MSRGDPGAWAANPSNDYRRYGRTRVAPTPNNRCANIDIKELQKREILKHGPEDSRGDSGSNFRFSTIGKFPLINSSRAPVHEFIHTASEPTINTPTSMRADKRELGVEDYYVYFDSCEKDEANSNLANGILAFDVMKLNKDRPIENIIEMEINEFFIPDIDRVDDNFPDYYFYKRVTMFLKEFESQSIIATNNTKFHWDFDVAGAGISKRLIPLKDGKKFTFRQPIRDLHFATFEFGKPITRGIISFQPDCITATSVAVNPGRFTTSVPHELDVGTDVSVFFEGFNSGIPTVNDQVNDQDGHLMTVIDATTLEFKSGALVPTPAIDLIGAGGFTAKLTIGFRRIAFMIRFRTITDKTTNFINP